MMQFSKGSKLQIRRRPGAPLLDAYVDDIWVEIVDDKLGVMVLLEVQENEGSRPNPQVKLGVFHFKMWADWAEENDDDPHDSRERGERPEN